MKDEGRGVWLGWRKRGGRVVEEEGGRAGTEFRCKNNNLGVMEEKA